LEDALRTGLAARGIPASIYTEYVPRNIFGVLFPLGLCGRPRQVSLIALAA
jgi:hypothetical protein